MRNILVLLVAFALIGGATGAYALNESDSEGQLNITSCYMIGVGDTTSGNVVVLTDDADTTRTIEWPGKEVTYTTAEEPIYGVIVDSRNMSNATMANGRWVRVQTYGYVPTIKICTEDVGGSGGALPRIVTGGTAICAGGTYLDGNSNNVYGLAVNATGDAEYVGKVVTSNAISLGAVDDRDELQATTDGWLYW